MATLRNEREAISTDVLVLKSLNSDIYQLGADLNVDQKEKLVKAVLRRMVKKDKVFITYEEIDPNSKKEIQMVKFHPCMRSY